MRQLVEVAVFAPLRETYTYSWPGWLGTPVAGIRVRVPFGRGNRMAVVCDVDVSPPAGVAKHKILDVADRLDREPLYGRERRRWLERLQRYYLAGTGEAWELALAWAQARDGALIEPPHSPLPARFAPLASAWRRRGQALMRETVAARAQADHGYWLLEEAVQQGVLVERSPSELPSRPLQKPGYEPTQHQQQALDAIIRDGHGFCPFLLFGCTGSGKTEVYLRAAAEHVQRGGQVLILVPEIGLTPMWLNRVCARFGERVGVWHSGLSRKEKWQLVARLHAIDVLIGTRSALFLPLPRLTMIVVDEEHDPSFKQQEGVRYSARDAAVLLAQELKIPVVLGSATPSLESWRQAREGHYRLLSLPSRITDVAPPQPEIIDLRQHGHDWISPALSEAIRETLDAGEQLILFLNRRGFAPALQCCACGHIAQCPDCSMRLTLHRRAARLRCHLCGYARKVESVCLECGESALMPLGEGTERIEEWLRAHFPEHCFARFDRDAVRSVAEMSRILDAFSCGSIHGLIGTQMLVKGHHFPNVTLVGVLNADLGMGLPDFRAGERWWQQMVQVIGRCGRGDRPGRVLIQTRMPEAAWLSRLQPGCEESVLDQELALRESLGFPPYARWVRLVFGSRKQETAWQVASALASSLQQACKGWPTVELNGPMLCPIERVGGVFRVELVLRDRERQILPWKLIHWLDGLKLRSAVRMRVDVDPQDMM